MQTDFALTMTINAENILKGALAKSWRQYKKENQTAHKHVLLTLTFKSKLTCLSVFCYSLSLFGDFLGLGLGKLIIFEVLVTMKK